MQIFRLCTAHPFLHTFTSHTNSLLTRQDVGDVLNELQVGVARVAPPHRLQHRRAAALRRHVQLVAYVTALTYQVQYLQQPESRFKMGVLT